MLLLAFKLLEEGAGVASLLTLDDRPHALHFSQHLLSFVREAALEVNSVNGTTSKAVDSAKGSVGIKKVHKGVAGGLMWLVRTEVALHGDVCEVAKSNENGFEDLLGDFDIDIGAQEVDMHLHPRFALEVRALLIGPVDSVERRKRQIPHDEHRSAWCVSTYFNLRPINLRPFMCWIARQASASRAKSTKPCIKLSPPRDLLISQLRISPKHENASTRSTSVQKNDKSPTKRDRVGWLDMGVAMR